MLFWSPRECLCITCCSKVCQIYSHSHFAEAACEITHSCQNSWSATSIVTIICSELTISWQRIHIYSLWSLPGMTTDYRNIYIVFPDWHSNRDFWTLYTWNEFSQFSIDCIPRINRHIDIHYIHEHLQILVVDHCPRCPLCGSRYHPILNVDSIDPVHMYSQDCVFPVWRDTFPLFEEITICTY